MVKQSFKNMTLKQAEAIRDNQYRSADNSQDYCQFSIEERILEIKIKQASKIIGLQEEPQVVFDNQLSGLMSVTMSGKHLLSLIDYALKTAQFSCSVEVESHFETRHGGEMPVTIYADIRLVNGVPEIEYLDIFNQSGNQVNLDANDLQIEMLMDEFWAKYRESHDA